jgi:hypothetical protein
MHVSHANSDFVTSVIFSEGSGRSNLRVVSTASLLRFGNI